MYLSLSYKVYQTAVYYYLSLISLNSEFQSEAQCYGQAFFQVLKKMQESVTA